jgi:hypothetical protein
MCQREGANYGQKTLRGLQSLEKAKEEILVLRLFRCKMILAVKYFRQNHFQKK